MLNKWTKITLAAFGVLSIALPIAIYFAFQGPTTTQVSAASWTSGDFLAYVGSILGAWATILAVIFTIRSSREESAEAKRLELMPYLDVQLNSLSENKFRDSSLESRPFSMNGKPCPWKERNCGYASFEIFNGGNASAVKITIQKISSNSGLIWPWIYFNPSKNKKTRIVMPGSKIVVPMSIVVPKRLAKESIPKSSKRISEVSFSDIATFQVTFSYEDVIGNPYEHTVEVSCDVEGTLSSDFGTYECEISRFRLTSL